MGSYAVTYKCFDVSIENYIAHIVLNRPDKRNSMIPEFWDELPVIIKDLDDHARARVIVLSATGPHFTSGLDTAVFGSTIENSNNQETLEKLERQRSAKFYDTVKYMQQTFSCLENCRVPVLAAIQGGAIGGGVEPKRPDVPTRAQLHDVVEIGLGRLPVLRTELAVDADVELRPGLCIHQGEIAPQVTVIELSPIDDVEQVQLLLIIILVGLMI